jgi:prolipoprotein diacylglyceryltransferase
LTFPVGFRIGDSYVTAHSILEFAAIFIAFRYYLFLKKRRGDHIASTNRLFIVVAATFGAVLGSRLLGAMENIPVWISSPSPWSYFWGNKTLAGGLIGGLVMVELVKKLLREHTASGDLFVYPLLLGMIIGRVGCFTAGIYEETYGIPSKLPWAMDLGDGTQRHPVTLYEIMFLMLLWITLYRVQHKYQLKNGALFKIFMIGYLAFRFLLDFIKPGWRFFMGLGTIQLACLLSLTYYYKYLFQPKLLLDTNAEHAG